MEKLKAVIVQNIHGLYVITIERDRSAEYLPSVVSKDHAYTLKGARKKANKMLAKERRASTPDVLVEVIR
jgi:hypothetical protein